MFTRICTDDYVCWTLQLIVKLLTVPTIYVVRKQVQSLLCDDSHGHLRLFRGCLEATWGGTFPWTSSSSRCPPEAGVRGLDASHCHLRLLRGWLHEEALLLEPLLLLGVLQRLEGAGLDASHCHLMLFRGCLEATWGGTSPWTSSSSPCPPVAGGRGLGASPASAAPQTVR